MYCIKSHIHFQVSPSTSEIFNKNLKIRHFYPGLPYAMYTLLLYLFLCFIYKCYDYDYALCNLLVIYLFSMFYTYDHIYVKISIGLLRMTVKLNHWLIVVRHDSLLLEPAISIVVNNDRRINRTGGG